MIDPYCATWSAIREWAQVELRRRFDELALSQPQERTENLRGHIQALQALLSLADPLPALDQAPDDYEV